MYRLIDHLALNVDVLLERLKVRAMRGRLRGYPNIAPSVQLGVTVQMIGPAEAFWIGSGTYINDAIMAAGSKCKIQIGRNCAIGYRVSIKALTHDVSNPSPDINGAIATLESDITIGDSCWIGDNVFIREGICIGNNVVVGANSVVTRSIPDNTIVAGAPARIIRKRDLLA